MPKDSEMHVPENFHYAPLYVVLAREIDRRWRIAADDGWHSPEMVDEIRNDLDSMVQNYLPHGSGIDNGVTIDHEQSRKNKIVLNLGFHHMDDYGYSGWTEHTAVIQPCLSFGYSLKITGRNRNEIKQYLQDVLSDDLDQEMTRAKIGDTWEWHSRAIVEHNARSRPFISDSVREAFQAHLTAGYRDVGGFVTKRERYHGIPDHVGKDCYLIQEDSSGWTGPRWEELSETDQKKWQYIASETIESYLCDIADKEG